MSITATIPQQTAITSRNTSPIRVMIVDDSVVVRGLVSRWIEEVEDLAFAGKFSNGLKAVEGVKEANPDIIILDIEMPVMDGLEALPKLIEAAPAARVIMASTLTQRNADISLKAMSLGAADYCPKPVSNSGVSTSEEFKTDLLQKIRALGKAARRARPRTAPQPDKAAAALQPLAAPTPAAATETTITGHSTRKFSPVKPRVLVIGSSTGGPPAVIKVLEELAPTLRYLPVLITQHMPATFTGIFASHIAKATGADTHEGEDGEALIAGKIYVAPGGRHMSIDRLGAKPVIKLTDGPEINYCKPAVDPLFETAATVYGPACLALVLTGMGTDGALGAVRVADAGGSVIAQDEATSIVWGMPGATAKSGACSAVLPVNQIAKQINALIEGRAS